VKGLGVTGRADLVWALAGDVPNLVEATAALLGFAPRAQGTRAPISASGRLSATSTARAASELVPPAVARVPLRPSTFWQAESYRYFGDTTAPEQLLPHTDVEWTDRPTEPLKTYLLSHWRDLQPRLRTRAALPAATRTPDVERAVALISRGRQLLRMPYEQRLRWGPRVQIILDRSERLVPIWSDQDVVSARLAALLPAHAVEQAIVWDDVQRPRILASDGGTRAYRLPPPGALVLVIGDLGCAERGGRELHRRWARFGASLCGAGCRTAVLTPLPPQRWTKSLSQHWTWIPWERARALSMGDRQQAGSGALDRSLPALDPGKPAQAIASAESSPQRFSSPREDTAADTDRKDCKAAIAGAESPAQEAERGASLERLLAARAERLLALVSPAIRIEPGFLRAVRLLLPAGEADAGTEIDVWQHPVITSTSLAGASLDSTIAARLRARFADEAPALQRRVLALLRAWRRQAPQELWFEEIQSLAPRLRALLPAPRELELAERFFRQLSQRARGLLPGGVSAAAVAWYRRCERRLPERVWTEGAVGEALQRLSWTIHKDEPDYRPVATFDPGNAPTGVHHRLRLVQVGENLQLDMADQAETELSARSTLGSMETGNDLIRIEVETSGAQDSDAFWESAQAPTWATDWGWDQYGAWVEFSVEDKHGGPVIRCMRWIEAGTFLMGSSAEEPGRWDHGGPRHEVRIQEGFWLFETACTQALWQAVMRENPSRFTGADRPVEGVSWDDAQCFVAELNGRMPGLGLSLPSEAQWEYACRAGSTTRYSFGDEEGRLGEHAWYSENAGGATHPVKGKQPNAWGIYDMLGNVWEWTLDAWHGSYNGAPADGSAWESDKPGADRVIRGGSWGEMARGCRCAFRAGGRPEIRNVYLGFRCARAQGREPGQAGSGASGLGAARPPERVRPGGAEDGSRSAGAVRASNDQLAAGRPQFDAMDGPRTGGSRGAARREATAAPILLRLDAAAHAAVELPDALAIEVRTDRERLTLRRIQKPKWASAMGRDRFGLWAEISVDPRQGEPVVQRLRWIPPGRFLMGSPPDEPGRDDDEGPRHVLTLASGYWLFDTPCTQALWEAVTGGNPSEFRTPERPVERVSWGDAQDFLEALNGRLGGVEGRFHLPSETQWEYACRAGSESALYSGPIQILGDANAPALDAIAWYGGNSGVGFELENGWERGWLREKMQYPEGRAGTHPVKGKQPNAWGLYDMLGNVWGWVQDAWHKSYEGAPADGAVWESEEANADRGIRGGSWSARARLCRSASRLRAGPGARDYDRGFRCARAQGW
jgi:formylglycine-generating enzyme required for sulfatase activity